MTDQPQLSVSKGLKGVRVAGSALGLITALSIILTGFTLHTFIEYLGTHAEQESESLRRIEEKNEAVSSMRIDQCHAIMDRSLDSLDDVAEAYNSQSDLLKAFTSTMRSLEGHMNAQTEQLREINKALVNR